MARFQYRCAQCGHEQEVTHPIGREEQILCPAAAHEQSGVVQSANEIPLPPLMRIKPGFTPLLYSSSTAYFGQSQQYPKAGPR